MLVYNYDDNGFYTSSEQAFLDPAASQEKGERIYFLPANATFKVPPEQVGYIAKYVNDDWVLVPDYRGKYYVDNTMIPTEIKAPGELENGQVLITDEQKAIIEEHPNYYIIENNQLVKNPDYEREEQEEQEEQFNREFFNTSLGYVRRKVTMKDGSIKDFLSDILPLLAVGVPVLTYTRELEQSKVIVTEQFINECKQQVLIDFYGSVA